MRIQFAIPGFREIEKILAKPIPDFCRGFIQKTFVFEPSKNLDKSVLVAQEDDFWTMGGTSKQNIFLQKQKAPGYRAFSISMCG